MIRVLIVDDYLDGREALAVFLSRAGLDVALAASVDEAMQILPAYDPAVVISDVAMPERDGFEFVSAIRNAEEHSSHRLGVIAVTALADPDARQRALGAGFDRYFVKPVDPSRVLDAVRHCASVTL